MDQYLDHERLEVYQVGRELSRDVAGILGELPRGCRESAENLGRATRSITRNIAEAGGRWTTADKANFYHIARGSATECAASLDELVDFGFVTAERVAPAKVLAWRVVSMLVGLIRSLDVDPPHPAKKGGPHSESRPQHENDQTILPRDERGRRFLNLNVPRERERLSTSADLAANHAEDS